jgi:cobalt-precorrin 5A hydrolase
MVGGEALIVAGIGCRRGCPADTIVALVRRAEALGEPADALAAPAFKQDEPGLRQAATLLGMALIFEDAATMAAAQPRCVTRSAAAERATGFASVAEAAALGADGVLVVPRLVGAGATCALARR